MVVLLFFVVEWADRKLSGHSKMNLEVEFRSKAEKHSFPVSARRLQGKSFQNPQSRSRAITVDAGFWMGFDRNDDLSMKSRPLASG